MFHVSRFLFLASAVWTVSFGVASAAGDPSPAESPAAEISWQTDYATAIRTAMAEEKMLLIFFHRPGKNPLGEYFESKILAEPSVGEKLPGYICAKLPVDVKIRLGGKDVPLLDHAAFRQMRDRQGAAILDYVHKDAPYYGRVVSALPFTEDHCYSAPQMTGILDLPPGTAAQRWRSYAQREKQQRRVADAEPSVVEKQPSGADVERAVEIDWLTDYTEAVAEAERQGKMLLIYFCDMKRDQPCTRFKAETLDAPMVREKLQDYVCAQLPLGAATIVQGKPTTLLGHWAFREMLGRPGVAILDYAHHDTRHYGCVVSTFPIQGKLWYTPQRMAVILDLPPGTLTQRTLIYAVRIHPERPASTSGRIDGTLSGEAERHSRHQARIRRQGHHQWDTRFHRINARLPRGLTAREVCAESWPGESLVEAALECVRSWRGSSGHWRAVRARHRVYGYDMKRGSNGIWYATGIFGEG